MTITEFERRANEEYVIIWSKMYEEMNEQGRKIERQPKVNWDKLDPEIQAKVEKYFGLDKSPKKERKVKAQYDLVRRPKQRFEIIERKPFVRPKAEYSNRSPYGIATELLNFKD